MWEKFLLLPRSVVAAGLKNRRTEPDHALDPGAEGLENTPQ